MKIIKDKNIQRVIYSILILLVLITFYLFLAPYIILNSNINIEILDDSNKESKKNEFILDLNYSRLKNSFVIVYQNDIPVDYFYLEDPQEDVNQDQYHSSLTKEFKYSQTKSIGILVNFRNYWRISLDENFRYISPSFNTSENRMTLYLNNKLNLFSP